MNWLRLWHDMPTDPKWRTIARHSGQPVTTVIAIYTFMLVNASESKSRGSLQNWDSEDVASALDLSEVDVEAVITAMQGRVLEDGRLTGWENRQPKREDDSTERVRNHRNSKETHCNKEKHDVTNGNAPDKRRVEKRREDSEAENTTTAKSAVVELPIETIAAVKAPVALVAVAPIPTEEFHRWWGMWSAVRGTNHPNQAAQAWISIDGDQFGEALFACTQSYLASLENPAKGYNPENFLFDQAKDHFRARWPARASPKRSSKAEQGLTDFRQRIASRMERSSGTEPSKIQRIGTVSGSG